MSSITLNVADAFPPGTSVAAYPRSNWVGDTRPGGAPVGSSAATATVASDGTLTFASLTDGVVYEAYARVGGVDRYRRFMPSTPQSSAGSGGGLGAQEIAVTAATGVVATDTANLQAAHDNAAAGATLLLDGHYKINAAFTITKPIALKARQRVHYTGLGALPSGPNAPGQIIGAIIEQTTAATDGIAITTQGGSFTADDVIVLFTSGLASTGHGFNLDPGSNIVGVYGGALNGCYVFGHDGNHYALVRSNSLEVTTRDFRWSGGGGILDSCQAGSINYGNTVDIHPYGVLAKSGSAHGYAKSSAAGATTPASGGMLNLHVMVRPQCNIAGTAANTTQRPYSDAVGAGFPWFVTIDSPDLESSGFTNPGPLYGPGTLVTGSVYQTVDSLNTQVGYKALATAGQNSGTQHKSVAVGNSALAALATGSADVAVGYFALSAATGNNNTAIGYTALQGLTTGTQNTAIGQSAGFKGAGNAGWQVTTGSSNTHIGAQAGPGSAADVTSTTALGRNATVIGQYSLALGSGTGAGASGAVAIGTDHNGLSASTTTQDEIMLGVANHQVKISNNATGAVSAALGANCPATTGTAPYTWFKMRSSDGSTVYVPAWK